MDKKEFLKELRYKLNKENYDDVDGIIDYYDELIEDRIERTNEIEKEVIKDLGSVDDIVKKVCGSKKTDRIKYEEEITDEDKPSVKNNNTKKDSTGIWIVILIITSPLWFGLVSGIVALHIAIYCAGFGVGVASLVFIALGVASLFSTFTAGLISLGIGAILLGAAFIIIPLLVAYAKLLFIVVKKSVKWLIGKISAKGEAN